MLRLPFCNLGRLDVLLKFLEEELLLPFGDEDRRVCDLTCWGRFLLEAKVRYVPVVSGSSTGGAQAASNS